MDNSGKINIPEGYFLCDGVSGLDQIKELHKRGGIMVGHHETDEAIQDEANKHIKSIVQKIIENGGDPKDYTITSEIGLLEEDFANDQYTIRLTVTLKAEKKEQE